MTPSSALSAPSFDVWVEVETPEQIAFSYSVAGVGSRGAAAALDTLICAALLIGLMLLTAAASGFLGLSGGGVGSAASSASWVIAVYLIAQFVVLWGYYVFFEGLWDGQTPGKRLMQLRVVRDGGYSVSFSASAVRNLLRIVDAMPIPLYLVGIIAAMLNPSRKRLGDLVAGTFVIKEGRSAPRTVAPSEHAIPERPPISARLTDDEYAVLDRYVERRQTFEPERRRAIATQLADRLAPHLDDTANPSAALLRLHSEERTARASGIAARSDTGARREQHAIVALGLKRWNDFAAALDSAKRRGLKHMSAEEVSQLVAQYREITTDLARLQTATRGRSSDAVFFLSRLVARGHNMLYGQGAGAMSGIMTYLLRTVPREVRRSWRQIALAAVLLFAPALVTYTAVVRDPSVAEQLLPDEMLSRASTGAAREKRGEGYVTISEDVRPMMASAIITNNVQIAYMAFALGITGGIGTIILLVLNGVSIGSGVGIFAAGGIARLILAFMLPHGVLELTAVCVAGGGGLLIAQGMVLPGTRTRRDALVENGKRAINLIAAATLILLVAGSIEGLISPRVWPMAWKAGVSGATALVLIFYLSLGRGAEDSRTPTVQSVP